MSENLKTHFENRPIQDLQEKLDALKHQIHPAFSEQFKDYSNRILWILWENVWVAHDPLVQNAVANANEKIEKALSWHMYSLQVEKAVTQAANDTSWEHAA